MRSRPLGRNPESGYAMLMVFAMAAAGAIMLYIELPRVAFEAQRTQEQILIERGQQYARAIQLYHRRFKVYPPTLEALENTNNIRYLRRRYKDPMTGEDQWRLIRGTPQGMLVDSLVEKPPQVGKDPTKKEDKDTTATSGEPGQTQETRAYMRRRQSDSANTNLPLLPGEQDYTAQQPDPSQPPQPGQQPPAEPGQQQPGQQQPGQQQPGQPENAQANQANQTSGQQRYPAPGNLNYTGSQYPPPAPAQQNRPAPGTPGQGNEAMNMINKILTTPRPGGLSGLQSSGPTLTGGAIGIAGVATKYEGEGIKVYNERSKYQEWEFVYSPQKDPLLRGPAVGGVSGLPGQPNRPGEQTRQPDSSKPKP